MHTPIAILIGTVSFILVAIFSFSAGIAIGIDSATEEKFEGYMELMSVIGVWVTSLGTLAAVATSLYLAHQARVKNAEILDIKLAIQLIPTISDERYIGVNIVSKGDKPANITSLSFGKPNAEVHALVHKYHQASETLPKILHYGQRANFLMIQGFQNALKNFIKENLNGNSEGFSLYVETTTETTRVPLSDEMVSYIENQNG